MNKKIIPVGVSIICCAGFLILVLAPGGCAFNLLPYEIHESLFAGGRDESRFIKIFDVLFSVGIFLLVFWTLKKILERKGTTPMVQSEIPGYLEMAFTKNYSCKDTEKTVYSFYTVDMGFLNITEGSVIACDPFLYNDHKPFDTLFPKGLFPVELAIAKIHDDERTGFGRIKFSGQLPVRWAMAVTEAQDLSSMDPGDIYGYGVDSGTGCFMDTSGAGKYAAFLDQQEDNHTKIMDEMDLTYKHTRSWLLWENDGFNVAMFSTGWGDGVYATYLGFDADGRICRLVTDFGLLDWPG